MRTLYLSVLSLTLALLVSGEAMARKYAYDDFNNAIDLYYGTVIEVENASIKSRAGKGAIIGGMAGLAYGHHKGRHKEQKAIEGAIAGALIASLMDRHKKKARSYVVRTLDGHTMEMVSEEKDIREGDCVQIEDAHRANIRRVSDAYCEDTDYQLDRHEIHHARKHASDCDTAKSYLLEAVTEEDINRAERKVRMICN